MKDELKEIILPIVETEGLIFKSVELGERDGKKTIEITVDKEASSVDVDDCAKVSKLIDAVLEKRDPFDGESYLLIVSSPGS